MLKTAMGSGIGVLPRGEGNFCGEGLESWKEEHGNDLRQDDIELG